MLHQVLSSARARSQLCWGGAVVGVCGPCTLHLWLLGGRRQRWKLHRVSCEYVQGLCWCSRLRIVPSKLFVAAGKQIGGGLRCGMCSGVHWEPWKLRGVRGGDVQERGRDSVVRDVSGKLGVLFGQRALLLLGRVHGE